MDFIRKNIRRTRDLFLFLKLFRKRGKLHEIDNNNILFLQQEDEFYRAQYKKYRSLIEKGVVPEKEQQRGNKVFICWLQGEEQAPPLVKACINSVRQNMPDKELVILDEKTIPQYVSLPDYIWEKRKNGIISHAHFSDLLRISLLCEYGGIWCDATVLCTSTPPACITDAPMFVFKAMDLIRCDRNPTICSNWYMEAWSNQRILLLTRKLLFEYWKTAESVGNYFVFHIFLAMAAERYPDEWKAIPVYNNHSPHTLQFELADPYSKERWDQILSFSPIHKLNHHLKFAQEDNFYQHVLAEYEDIS